MQVAWWAGWLVGWLAGLVGWAGWLVAGWLVGRLAAGWLAGYGTLISIVGLCVANCAGIVACKNTCINSPHFVVLAPKWVYVLLTPQSLPTHGPTLVHVHIYTSVDPCIYARRKAEQSTVAQSTV